jgi:hypothetical protein
MVIRRFRLPALLACTVLLLSVSTSNAAQVTFTPIGNPTWEPVDFHIFSGPIGASPNFPDFIQTTEALLPPPNHRPHPELGVGPGDPHAPPYDQELATGVANLGFADKDFFRVPEFSGGNGVYFIWMLVPRAGAPVGSSPDFASGPIIPNTVAPIELTGTTFRNGVDDFSLPTSFAVPALDAVTPAFNVQGHSHIPIFFVESFDFGLPGQPPTGSFEIRVNLTDQTGNGWNVAGAFEVQAVPEPGTVLIVGCALATLAASRRLRRHEPY